MFTLKVIFTKNKTVYNLGSNSIFASDNIDIFETFIVIKSI